MSLVYVLKSMKHFRGSHQLISRQVTNTKTAARPTWHNSDHQILGRWESIWGKLCHTAFSWWWYCCTSVRECWHVAQLEQKLLDKMTDHRVSDFVFKKSNVVAPASTYPAKATSDTVSVDLLLLLQQYIFVGYNSRELVDVLKYEPCVYPTTLFETTGTMLQSGKPTLANPLNSMETEHTYVSLCGNYASM